MVKLNQALSLTDLTRPMLQNLPDLLHILDRA
jgi:hypothetical protein